MKRGVGPVHAAGVGLVVQLPTDVGGEDDGRVAEGHVALVILVLQRPGIQNLQEQLDRVPVRFLDLIEQQYGCGVLLDELGQRSGMGGVEALGYAEQLLVLLVAGIGAHVKPLERPVQGCSAQFGQEGLTDARRPGEDEQRPGRPAPRVG